MFQYNHWTIFLLTTIVYVNSRITYGYGNFGGTYVSKPIKRYYNESYIEELIKSLILPELEQMFCVSENPITDIDVQSRYLYLEGTKFALGEIINLKFTHFNSEHHVTISTTEVSSYITQHSIIKNQHPQDKNLKVMSYNIFNYNDFWEKRVYLITDLISKLLPDIIGFQEVRLDETQFKYDDSHQVTHLKNLLIDQGYINYVYQSAMLYSYPRSEEGLAIFSKYPIVDSSYILLSRDRSDPGSHQRICLYSLIKTPIGFIQFFNTHLELKLEMSEQNAHDILEFAEKKLIDLDSPQILVGDMNSEPSSETIKRFGSSFKDSWKEYNPKGSGLTFSTNGQYKKRIDFVFYRNFDKNVKDFKIFNKKKEVDASDHFGIQVEYK